MQNTIIIIVIVIFVVSTIGMYIAAFSMPPASNTQDRPAPEVNEETPPDDAWTEDTPY